MGASVSDHSDKLQWSHSLDGRDEAPAVRTFRFQSQIRCVWCWAGGRGGMERTCQHMRPRSPARQSRSQSGSKAGRSWSNYHTSCSAPTSSAEHVPGGSADTASTQSRARLEVVDSPVNQRRSEEGASDHLRNLYTSRRFTQVSYRRVCVGDGQLAARSRTRRWVVSNEPSETESRKASTIIGSN